MEKFKDMRKYTYKLKTLSPLILSPRSSMAFYKDALINDCDEEYFKTTYIDDKEKEQEKSYKILYSFYRYGEYDLFNPSEAQYYIPGSSIKGALNLERKNKANSSLSFFVDDITGFTGGNFEIISLKKSQYLEALSNEENKKTPKITYFFDGTVGIEVMKKDVAFTGGIRFCGEDINGMFEYATNQSHERLERYRKQVQCFKNGNNLTNDEMGSIASHLDDPNGFDKIDKQLDSLLDKNNLIFLGGYKGLIRSVSCEVDNFRSAIFVDNEYLPFGIVEVDLESIKEVKSCIE